MRTSPNPWATHVNPLLVTFLLWTVSMCAGAQNDPSAFPAAAVQFLDREMPEMEKAIAAKDRVFFEGSKMRMQAFLEEWGLRSRDPVALDRYPMCRDAVTDYLIVGLCKISPPGSICDPSTFFPRFEANLQSCRIAQAPTRRSHGPSTGGASPPAGPAG